LAGREDTVLTIPSDLEVSNDRSRLDVDLIHDFLSRSSYWAQGRSRATVERTIANSLCFGAYSEGKMVGFGRVVTDYAVIGYLADIFVVPELRGRGVGKALVQAMVEHPDIAGLQVVLLRSTDARSFYASFGFTDVPRAEEMMGRYRATRNRADNSPRDT
jgi:N-acetylglutamate synthase-like GNAT family acetyltransferase